MVWTKEHDAMLTREMLVIQLFRYKHWTRDRGRCWEQIAQNLNSILHPKFNVDMIGLMDRFAKLEKSYRKKGQVKKANAICPDLPDELDQALEQILQLVNKEQREAGEKRKEMDEEKKLQYQLEREQWRDCHKQEQERV